MMQMIDPYWTVIPVMLVHYYATHPLANYDSWRSKIVIFLTWVWSIRLTHNYFRREKWQWGAREDWRFTEMSEQYGKHWWWISFFAVYVSQQVGFFSVKLNTLKLFDDLPVWFNFSSK
jgi:steroid 5-alpha reductase family enzyme